MNGFSSKVVLITGSSTGIGADLAKAFAKEKANLVITARRAEVLSKVADECKTVGGVEVLTLPTDLTLKENMEMVMMKTIEKFGRLDVLVNNAGTHLPGSIRDVALEDFDQVMSINSRTPMYMTHLAIPYLEKSKGSIINVSSVYSTSCSQLDALSYSISKATQDRLTKLAALELASSGIRVNSIIPAFVLTPMFENEAKHLEISVDDFVNLVAPTHPLNERLVKTQEISDAIIFLASDKANMITGVSLPVDGGKLLGVKRIC